MVGRLKSVLRQGHCGVAGGKSKAVRARTPRLGQWYEMELEVLPARCGGGQRRRWCNCRSASPAACAGDGICCRWRGGGQLEQAQIQGVHRIEHEVDEVIGGTSQLERCRWSRWNGPLGRSGRQPATQPGARRSHTIGFARFAFGYRAGSLTERASGRSTQTPIESFRLSRVNWAGAAEGARSIGTKRVTMDTGNNPLHWLGSAMCQPAVLREELDKVERSAAKWPGRRGRQSIVSKRSCRGN